MVKYNKKFMYIALAIYIMLLIWVIVFKWTNYIAAQECIITFRKLDLAERFLACKKSLISFDFSDLILNMLLFLLMGFIFAPLFKKKYLILIMAVACSLVFEISQFFTCIGMSNIFDFLGNTVGCVMGFAIFLLLEKRITKRFIDITNIVVIILGAPLCIYAIVMTIINFHCYL